MKYFSEIGNVQYSIEFNHGSDLQLIPSSDISSMEIQSISQNTYSVLLDGKSYTISVLSEEKSDRLAIGQKLITLKIRDEIEYLLDSQNHTSGANESNSILVSPIPGRVGKIFLTEGNSVKNKEKLIIIEAMKMENEILSTADGIVEHVFVNVGDLVEKGTPLFQIQQGGKAHGNQ